MAAPGLVLSQPTISTSASSECPIATSSMESAISSRLWMMLEPIRGKVYRIRPVPGE